MRLIITFKKTKKMLFNLSSLKMHKEKQQTQTSFFCLQRPMAIPHDDNSCNEFLVQYELLNWKNRKNIENAHYLLLSIKIFFLFKLLFIFLRHSYKCFLNTLQPIDFLFLMNIMPLLRCIFFRYAKKRN